MKRYGKFYSSLLEYENVLPTITMSNNKDKYIISGNPDKRMVSLIFIVDNNSDIESILSILNNEKVKGNFFIDNEWLENNSHKLENIINDPWIKDSYCETDVLDKTLLTEFLEKNVPYDNYDIDPEKIVDFIEQCPSLKEMDEETYQEISELTNLKSTKELINKVKKEIEESDELNDQSKQYCLEFIVALENQIKRTETESKTVEKMKEQVYRESILSATKKCKEDDRAENEELQNKIKEQMVKNQQLENQLLKIQDIFSKSKGGIENLASILYGKLSTQSLNGMKQDTLLCSLDKKEKTKGFKSMYVVLKDNFVFLFKSPNENSPIEVLLLTKPAQSVSEEKYGKPFCFIIEGYVFAANTNEQRDDWLKVTKAANKWYEMKTN